MLGHPENSKPDEPDRSDEFRMWVAAHFPDRGAPGELDYVYGQVGMGPYSVTASLVLANNGLVR